MERTPRCKADVLPGLAFVEKLLLIDVRGAMLATLDVVRSHQPTWTWKDPLLTPSNIFHTSFAVMPELLFLLFCSLAAKNSKSTVKFKG